MRVGAGWSVTCYACTAPATHTHLHGGVGHLRHLLLPEGQGGGVRGGTALLVIVAGGGRAGGAAAESKGGGGVSASQPREAAALVRSLLGSRRQPSTLAAYACRFDVISALCCSNPPVRCICRSSMNAAVGCRQSCLEHGRRRVTPSKPCYGRTSFL